MSNTSWGSEMIEDFKMDGCTHSDQELTNCCGNFVKICPYCNGWMHYQPVYGGFYYECEKCHEKF